MVFKKENKDEKIREKSRLKKRIQGMDLFRKKRFIILVVCVLMTALLAGCGRQELSVVIHSDGSADYVMTESLSKSKLEKKCKAAGMNSDQIKKLEKELKNQKYKLSKDGKSYVRTVKGSVKKSELKDQFKGYDEDAYASASVVYFRLDVKKIPSAGEMLDEISDLGIKISDKDITMKITLEFPKPVVHTTGKISRDNPNRVEFTTNIGKPITVFASTNKKITRKNFIKPGRIAFKKYQLTNVGETSRKLEIRVKKQKYATGYQLQYSEDKSFTDYKKLYRKNGHFIVKNLKSDTVYYVRIRAIRKLYNKQKVYSGWVKRTVNVVNQ